MSRSSRQVLMLILSYTTLAVAWGWRMHAADPMAVKNEEKRIETMRAEIAARVAEVPPQLKQAALFQLTMLPENEVRSLGEWCGSSPEQRLRQLTVQNGPVNAPCPLNVALVFGELSRADALPVDVSRLLISAAGDRLEEPHKIAALELLAKKAITSHNFNLALEIHQRIHESPAVGWRQVIATVEVARLARRPAAALRILNVWLDPTTAHLDMSQREDALDLQTELLLEGTRYAEASRIALDDLRSLKPNEAVPPRLLQRALTATQAAGEGAELLPWIERHLRSFAEHKLHVETIAAGKTVSADYRRWVREAAFIADRQNHTSIACDGFFRLAALGELRVLARLHMLATQMGRGKDLARLLATLQDRFSVTEIAQALTDGSAPQAARDLLAAHLKAMPNHREGWRLITQLEVGLRGSDAAPLLLEGFLKRFPGDVPALRQFAQLQLDAAQFPQALRTLQQIPGENLDEATLRQITALAIRLDDVPTAHRAQQLLVQGTPEPAVKDVLVLATLTRQQADPAAETALAESIARLPAQTAFQKMLITAPAIMEGTNFGTAVKAH